MFAVKIITGISWVLAGLYGAWVISALLQPNGPTDTAGEGVETAVKVFFCILFFLLIGLILLPFVWTKVIALIAGILLVAMAVRIKYH